MNFENAKEKASSIVSQMTTEEKISQLLYDSPAIDRLGIKEYNWWNEACHGVARAGIATVFPQTIGLSATFNPMLIHSVADAVSDEGRAKYNASIKYGDRGIYKGLTYWSPNINIFRDPRWGRGQETFGEDPYLTAVMGSAFIKGLQGDGEFLKAAACAKHFAVHSGPEKLRHSFNAEASEKDLQETYLPAFECAVKAGVAGVMGAYNRTNGEPCCASKRFIKDILRTKWRFDGYFVSDCGAVADITVLCLGLDRRIEGEDTGCENDFTDYGDKKTLYLPDVQMKLAEAVCNACKDLIVVTMCGSAVDLGEKVRKHAKAILHAWYPGALGGLAIAQLFAGMYSPSGRLPITFYNAKTELPDITNYNMANRTYRFLKDTPVYPFGYGLSYAEFEYNRFEILNCDDSEIKVNITLTNKGNMKAYEKMQIYAQYTDSRTDTPNYQLCAITAVELKANETKSVEVKIDRYWIKAVLENGERTEPNGRITLYAGGHQPDEYSERLYKYPCIKAQIR